MEKGKLEELLSIAIFASIEAGKEIMKIYSSNFNIELKDDNSPLTLADKKSNDTILNRLSNSAIPILSEEGKDIMYEEKMSHMKNVNSGIIYG